MAAAATVRATAQFSIRNDFTATIIRRSNYVKRRATVRDANMRLRKFPLVKSSGGDATAEPATSETPETEAPIEVAKETPSLISALNVEKALRGIAITDVDHYGRLGLSRGCSYDQVAPAYNKKVEELMNQGLEEEELNNNRELLKVGIRPESFVILSSREERRLYDWSLARNEKLDGYTWPFEADITQTPTQLPPPPEPEDEGPTRLVGYFFLGWLLLSFALSTAFNL